MKKGNKGFTLIELLVVIAIIAILSTVVMAGLNSARAKGRDAKRISEIKELQAALELYFDSCGGYPPNTSTAAVPGLITNTGADGLVGLNPAENDGNAADGCGASTMGTFMSVLPSNPTPGGEPYTYCGTTASLPATAANPLTIVECTDTSAASYLIGFNLEIGSGSLLAGDHNASPVGFK